MKKTEQARWMLITSMVIFGTLAPFVRRISVSSGELALYRAVMAAMMIGGFLLVTRQKIPFASIKKEDFRKHFYKTEAEFKVAVAKYIDFYNDYRPHQRLGYQTPNQAEEQCALYIIYNKKEEKRQKAPCF